MEFSLAFIPLVPNAKLSSSAIKSDFVAKWPNLPPPKSMSAKQDTLAFRVGESDIIIALMPAPIPWSDLEGPCESSWLWKEAESALKNHTRHLIVTVLSENDAVGRSCLLTQVCASILATCDKAPGVYWCNATLLVPSGLFQDFATEMLPEGLPLYIWVDFRVGPSGDGRICGFTTGMAALGHMEFETESSPESPGELRERFFGLASYVLENGPVIRDGDTVGEDAEERIRVSHSESLFGNKGKVMRLEYSTPAPRKSWFGR